MDYCLDSGDGTASIWTGAFDIDVDGDGELDGVRLDFDGDGVFDDALADFDADGLADHAALDLDDDGLPESRYTDNGSGTWMVGAGISEWGAASGGALRWFGLDGVEHALLHQVEKLFGGIELRRSGWVAPQNPVHGN